MPPIVFPRPRHALAFALLALLAPAAARADATPSPDTAPFACGQCEAWNAEVAPFGVHGDTDYVGVAGLSSLVLRTPAGLVLVDGGLPQSAPRIVEHLAARGLDIRDVRWILVSHPHFDHAGGVAALQRLSGATVVAPAAGLRAMRAGGVLPHDPQAGYAPGNGYPPVIGPTLALADGAVLDAGGVPITITHLDGHAPGGAAWRWPSCDAGGCTTLVYADSLSAVSTDDYRFTAHPERVAALERTFARIEALDCDLVVAPHPAVGGLFEREAARRAGERASLREPGACRAYAAGGRAGLARRLANEAANAP